MNLSLCALIFTISFIDSFGLFSFMPPKKASALLVSTCISSLSFLSNAAGWLLSTMSIFGCILLFVCSMIASFVISASSMIVIASG